MNLRDKRAEWEHGLEVVVEIPVLIEAFKKLYVVLHRSHRYSLHRYFKIGDGWDVSVDIRDEHDFDKVLEAIRGDKDVRMAVDTLDDA